MKKLERRIVSVAVIQLAVIIYSLSGVAGKLASGNPFMSLPFILLYGLEILCLGVYAIMWQQIIKRHALSVAYVNRALSLMWSMIWSALIFREKITIQNMIGAAIVVVGVAMVNLSEVDPNAV